MSPTSLSSPALLQLFGFWLAVNVFIIHQMGGGGRGIVLKAIPTKLFLHFITILIELELLLQLYIKLSFLGVNGSLLKCIILPNNELWQVLW